MHSRPRAYNSTQRLRRAPPAPALRPRRASPPAITEAVVRPLRPAVPVPFAAPAPIPLVPELSTLKDLTASGNRIVDMLDITAWPAAPDLLRTADGSPVTAVRFLDSSGAPIAIGGTPVGVAEAPADGQQYGRQDLGWTVVTPTPTSLPPSGAAGGSLTGTYPDPLLKGTLRSFGAVGNGTADDDTFLQAALNAQAASPGMKLDGEGLTYGSYDRLTTAAAQVWIENATFKDLNPSGATTGGGTTRDFLYLTGGSTSVILRNVTFNRNGTGSEGSLNAHTLRIDNCSNILLEEVEVHGNGGGVAITLAACTNVMIVRPYIHDMNWERPANPLGELIEGILLVSDCQRVLIEGHIIRNLTGTVLGVPQIGPVSNHQNTDGISIGNCADVRIVDGFTSNVGEGVDVTGSGLNRNIRLENNTYYDCSAYSEKFVHGTIGCSTTGGRYWRSGIHGLVVTAGPSATSKDFVATDCIAWDTGSTGLWTASQAISGFRTDWNVGSPKMTNIWFINCQAHSTTQEYGFNDQSASAAGEIHILGFETTGHTVAAVIGITGALSQISTTGRFQFTGGLDVLTGGLTGTTATFSGSIFAGASSVNTIGWTSGTSLSSISDGSLHITNNANTTGVRLDMSVNGTMRVMAVPGGANTATVRAATGNFDTVTGTTAAFSGEITAATPATADNDTTVATTAFVKAQGYLTSTTAGTTYLPLAGGTLTGALSGTSATLSSSLSVTGGMVSGNDVSLTAGHLNLATGSVITWATRGKINTASDGTWHFTNNAGTAGTRLNFTTDATLLLESTGGGTANLTVAGSAGICNAGNFTATNGFHARNQTAIGVGAATQYFVRASNAATPIGLFYGTGVPTFSAQSGSIYLRQDRGGANQSLYINTSGGAGTTWLAATTG